ncbi:MAG TPA: DJ-1/PfpI family protein [Gammaproteobacteria bacterium]|nr:DJ-1/PfpI family protein [Gammaproteobacteria bacterium]
MNETFGFLLFNDVEELDVVGPWEVISIWSKVFKGPENVVTVSEKSGIISCSRGLKIISEYDFKTCPKLDYLLVPGGWGERSESHNPALINFIKNTAKNTKALLSICTGSLLLQAAGLLDGKKATTHCMSLNRLRAFEKTTVVEERWTRDGNIWTAAGVTSGIDLALAFIADSAGEALAGELQYYLEYYPVQKRYGNLSQSKDAPKYLKT